MVAGGHCRIAGATVREPEDNPAVVEQIGTTGSVWHFANAASRRY